MTNFLKITEAIDPSLTDQYLITDSIGCRIGTLRFYEEDQVWIFEPDKDVERLTNLELDSISTRLKFLNESIDHTKST